MNKPDLSIPRPIEGETFVLLVTEIQRLLQKCHSERRLVLPDLQAFGNQTISLFSDYSGEGSGSFLAYSTVVCGFQYIETFTSRVRELRKVHGLGEAEIAFKRLGRGQMRRCVPDYLRLANNILPGFLLNILIDKRIASVLVPRHSYIKGELTRLLNDNGYGNYSKPGAEKLLRVVHIVAYLAALLARSGQKIFWMTDNDEICANPDAHVKTLNLFSKILQAYTPGETRFDLVGGATPFAESGLGFLDVLSIADLAAGSLHSYMTQRETLEDSEILIKHGADETLKWLAYDGVGMKKKTFVFRKGRGDEINVGEVLITLKDDLPEAAFVPVYVTV